MNKISLKKVVALLSCFLICGISFSQEEPTPDELEWLGDLDKPTYNIDSSLQSNFVIIESVSEHELNPHVTAMAQDSQFLTGLYEGLFSYNPLTLDAQYAIAVNYNISRDKKRWVFAINPNAYFSNGEKITAQHVRDSWIKLLSTKNAPYASLLDVIEGAQKFRNGKLTESKVGIYVLSDSELMIHLTKPANYLPQILCHPAFSIVHKDSNVYSGPYVLESHQNNEYVLVKNDYYWDKGNTHLKKITFIQSDDQDENAFAYNTGLADWVTGPVNYQKILGNNSIMMNAEFATNYFFFNLRKNKEELKPWALLDFRRALFEAIPWNEFRSGFYVPAGTFVYPLNGYPTVEGYGFTDMIEAKKLMAEARRKHGEYFGLDKGDEKGNYQKKIPLVMEITKNSMDVKRLYLLKKAWDQLGVDLIVREIPASDYFANVPKSDADIFMYTWSGDFADPLAFLELFRSDSTLNDSGYSNKKFDDLLDLASKSSKEQSYEYLSQAEVILLDSYEVIPILHPIVMNVINLECVGGWSTNAFDIHPLKYILKKQEKTKLPNVVKR